MPEKNPSAWMEHYERRMMEYKKRRELYARGKLGKPDKGWN